MTGGYQAADHATDLVARALFSMSAAIIRSKRGVAMTTLVSQLLLGACSVVGIRDGTPEPPAVVVDHVGAVEIRRYDPALVAETTLDGTEEQARYDGFRRLAGYIFGRNARRDRIGMTAPVTQAASVKIAMTAPVAQAAAPAGRWTIRFFLPAGMTEATAPQPLDPRVVLVAIPSRTMAVLSFSGLPTPASVAVQAARLDARLHGGRWHADGPVVTWFYDPPWTLPPFRRNEVARPVHLDQSGTHVR